MTNSEQNLNAYARAGVDTQAGDRAAELMKEAVKATHNATVVGGAGGFAGAIDASGLKTMDRPLLVTSTDGVGTKVDIARAMGVYDTIGRDLVGMVVDDITVLGAQPLMMTDYIACGRVYPQRIADIVRGIAIGAGAVDCPLVGGETAEHPGLLGEQEFDVAGAVTGVVDSAQALGSARVKAGDQLLAMASSGLHSNGYSLVRAIISEARWDWDRIVEQLPRPAAPSAADPSVEGSDIAGSAMAGSAASLGILPSPFAGTSPMTLGEAVLEPTRLYSRLCLQAAKDLGEKMRALSHVTGGGLGANLARVIPAGLAARVDRATWQIPPLFTLLRELGKVDDISMEDTLNLGVGMVALVAPESLADLTETCKRAGVPAWHIGEVVPAQVEAQNQERVISGTKGVHAGEVRLRGVYHW